MAIDKVCSSCFQDSDLRAEIRGFNGPRGCSACGGYDSPTMPLVDIVEHIESCLGTFWGLAVEQLPYESAEGGYQGQTWTTYDIVFDEVGLELPRDLDGELHTAIAQSLSDELWCDWDWLSLDDDVALQSSWERFHEVVKHERRFFFHQFGDNPQDRDMYSASSVLGAIASLSQQLGLIKTLPVRTLLWRARPDIRLGVRVTAKDFGPPPKAHALQSNRMNPPGIPMMYLASSAIAAVKETRATTSRVGAWRTLRNVRILDLRNLPEVPGFYSHSPRQTTLGLRFLWEFAQDITKPVERDERIHVDYLPSQVVTEFVRDYAFAGGELDGIAYPSVVHGRAWNLVLFSGTTISDSDDVDGMTSIDLLEFERAKRVSLA